MEKNRMEAFSDGVLAIVITIMVLEIKVSHGGRGEAAELIPLIPIFMSYTMSFVYIGIYWNNHHHMLQTVKSINGHVLLANLNLLFWLSLVPFTTAWMGENHFAATPTALYGVVLLMSALSYAILQIVLMSSNLKNSKLKQAIGYDIKGKISIALYLIAIVNSYYYENISQAIYALIALLWLIPDRRIEASDPME